MSQKTKTPSSSTRNGELPPSENDHGGVRPRDIVVGVVIGRTAEFFDFFVFAIASVLVFPKLVFAPFDPLSATLYSFALFSLAFVARPFGTVIFMAIDRMYGRGVKLTAAMFLLGTSTVAIAFLPGYAQIGVSSIIILALCRIAQGLAWGGAWDGLATLLAINVREGRYGGYAMIPQLGAMFGLILASLLFSYFIANLSATDFMDWGWRYPFFVAFAINIVALFARLTIVTTPDYKKLYQTWHLRPSPIGETVRQYGVNVIIGALAPLASFSLFHMVTIFPLSWVFLYTKENPVNFLIIEVIAAFVGLGCLIASGYLANRIGRRTLLFVMAIAIASFSGFAPQLLSRGFTGEIAYMIIGFILLGLSFGQSSGVVSANFPANYRYTGSAVTSDFAWLFGAAFAPVVALWTSSHFGLLMAGAYLLSGAIATIAALYVNQELKLRKAKAAGQS